MNMTERHKAPGTPRDVKVRGTMAPTIDRDRREISGLVTTTTIGIDGLILPASALDLSYFWGTDVDPGVRAVYYNHDYDALPVGKCITLKVQGDDLWCRTYVSRTGIGDSILTLVEEGILNGQSTGTRVRASSAPTAEERTRWNVNDRDAEVIRDGLLLVLLLLWLLRATRGVDHAACRGDGGGRRTSRISRGSTSMR
jgi:hypothetical protein